ncbi:MAG TPA: hypothetical protein VMM60_03415 [Ilumatobacter sp.]|nr:hypothetical protein [Ilumatobacter sp.]
MGRPEPSENDTELIRVATSRGVTITERQLDRWREQKLIPSPLRVALGHAGWTTQYPPSDVDYIIEFARRTRPPRPNEEIVLWLLRLGHDVPEACYRHAAALTLQKCFGPLHVQLEHDDAGEVADRFALQAFDARTGRSLHQFRDELTRAYKRMRDAKYWESDPDGQPTRGNFIRAQLFLLILAVLAPDEIASNSLSEFAYTATHHITPLGEFDIDPTTLDQLLDVIKSLSFGVLNKAARDASWPLITALARDLNSQDLLPAFHVSDQELPGPGALLLPVIWAAVWPAFSRVFDTIIS